MKNDSILFVGLDTHKTNTEVAYVIDGRENSPQHLGKILTNKQAVISYSTTDETPTTSALNRQ